MSGGFGGCRRGARRHRARARSGLTPIKVNAVVQRGINDHIVLDAGRALPRHRRDRALHRVHGRRQPQPLEPGLVVPSPSSPRRSARAGRCTPHPTNYRGEVAERYQFDDGSGEVGFVSSVSQPFCGDCSRARLSSDGVLYTCLFAASGHGPARRRCAPARPTRSSRHADRRRLARRRTATASCARAAPARGTRCARSRCTTSVAETATLDNPARARHRLPPTPSFHPIRPDPPRRRQPADHGRRRRQGRDRAQAVAEARVRCRPRGACAAPRTPSHPRRARCSTPRSSPACMAAKRTHELIPFCHPLGSSAAKSTSTRAAATTDRRALHRRTVPARPVSRWKH
jgi:hypothetical protein